MCSIGECCQTETKLWVDRPSSVVFAHFPQVLRSFCKNQLALKPCLGAWLHCMPSLSIFVFALQGYFYNICICALHCKESIFNAISWLPAALSDLGSATAVCRLCSLLTFSCRHKFSLSLSHICTQFLFFLSLLYLIIYPQLFSYASSFFI